MVGDVKWLPQLRPEVWLASEQNKPLIGYSYKICQSINNVMNPLVDTDQTDLMESLLGYNEIKWEFKKFKYLS